MAGTHVTIAATGSATFDSYVASPVSEKGAGVVIVSTISGVDSDMTYYADALAAEGFVASAPDMFWRDADPGPAALDRRRSQTRLRAQRPLRSRAGHERPCRRDRESQEASSM